MRGKKEERFLGEGHDSECGCGCGGGGIAAIDSNVR